MELLPLITLVTLVTVVLPDMLHQIILEPNMGLLLTNVTVEVEELSKCGRSLGLNQLTPELPCLIIQALVAFVPLDAVGGVSIAGRCGRSWPQESPVTVGKHLLR